MREHFYNVRVTVAETRKSMLRLFPGLSFNTARKHDDDSYVINQSWRETGAQLSMNLLNLLSTPSMLSLSEARKSWPRTSA